MAGHAGGRSGILRVAVAGLGSAARMMIPALARHPYVDVAAAADIDSEALHNFQQDFHAETYSSVEEMCQSSTADAVYIATPTQLHTDHALAALRAGKHVVLEKPMALSIEDADAMIEGAHRNRVHMVVGHSHSFETPIRKITEIVRSGDLGKLRMIHNWYYTDWIYRPRNREELDTSLGGGVVFRQGSHQFDILRMIGGGMVRSVRAMTGTWDESRPTQGSHVVYLEFEDGTPATAVFNGYDRFHTAELTFGVGEQGQLDGQSSYGRSRNRSQSMKDPEEERVLKRSSARYAPTGSASASAAPPHQPFYGLTLVSCDKGDIRQSADGLFIYGEEEMQEITLPSGQTGRDAVVAELYAAVVEGVPPAHGGPWGKANLEVCLAVLKSAKERREVLLHHQTSALS